MSLATVSPPSRALAPALAQRIVEIIRRENYAAGQRLTELALAQALNVSRSPVRKALQYLQSRSLVISEPHRGYQLAIPAYELGSLDVAGKASVDEDLYYTIAHARIRAELPPEVNESSLMEQYSATRVQVQRVLQRMSREGMIDRKPGRGWVFRPLLTDHASHRESYRFRMIVEPAALLEPGYVVQREELEKCRREQQELLGGGIERCTPAELFRAGVHFHETMMAGANNQFLMESLRSINQMRRVLEYGTRLDRSRLHQQCREHLTLIDLLLHDERMEASHFLRQHLNGARITKLGDGHE
jgi:DNA-binding GntR family transcriptional regulator